MTSFLPAELEFLQVFDAHEDNMFYSDCLRSPIESDHWEFVFGARNVADITIDFNVVLDDDFLLTHPKHTVLLKSIKQFILVQTHPYNTGGRSHSDASKYFLISRALHVVDHFLLNKDHYRLAAKGFSSVTSDSLRVVHAIISSHRSIKNSLYEPIKYLENFFRQVSVPKRDYAKVLRSHPQVTRFTEGERKLKLTDEQIINARIFLVVQEHYNEVRGDRYRYNFSAKRFFNQHWGNRILGNTKFDYLGVEELSFHPVEDLWNEFTPIPVNSVEDQSASSELVSAYVKTFLAMDIVNEHGVGMINSDVLKVLLEKPEISEVNLKARGRFATLPFEVSRLALEKAFDFYFDYGDSIIDGIVEYVNCEDQNHIPKSLKKLGVTRVKPPKGIGAEERYRLLRENRLLLDLRDVLYGAAIIIINTLMARRVSELERICIDDVIKEKGTRKEYLLRIVLSKANVGELRETILRPIPAVAAILIKKLSKIQITFADLGLLDEKSLFVNFSRSTKYGTIDFAKGDRHFFYRCLNRFCDYFEIPLDEKGRRWYIRPHQLRRNFAMLFFWQGKYGGLHVLSYFLGHKKPSHTWRYITESTPGKALTKVKADIAAKGIIEKSEELSQLVGFIKKRYGCNEISILPEGELSQIIQGLITGGEVKIEPEFLPVGDEEEYTITYKLTNQNDV